MQSPTVRIVLVEDDHRFRSQLTQVLTTEPRWHVVAQCADAISAIDEITRTQPSLIILDAHLPGLGGIDAIQRFKVCAPESPILMLSVENRPDEIFRALKSGANGYIIKGTSASETISAIKDFLSGGAVMTPAVASRIIDSLREQPENQSLEEYDLTPRQSEILEYVSRGRQRGEISLALGISENTVKNHLGNIYQKLGVRSRIEALNKVAGNPKLGSKATPQHPSASPSFQATSS